MDEQIQDVESIYNDDAAYEEEVAEGNGLVGKVLGCIAAGTLVGAGALAVKNKDRIKAKFEEIKANKQAKKVKKHLDALHKLGYQTDSDEAETKK